MQQALDCNGPRLNVSGARWQRRAFSFVFPKTFPLYYAPQKLTLGGAP